MTGPAKGRRMFFEGPFVKEILSFLSTPPKSPPPKKMTSRGGREIKGGGHVGGGSGYASCNAVVTF